MTDYSWSVCSPDKPEIEQRGSVERGSVENTFLRYPWKLEMQKLDSMAERDVHYSPSIRFTDTRNGRSLELTTVGSADKYSFWLWYERPVLKKSFLGLLGEKEKLEVIDKEPFSYDEAAEILRLFVQEQYDDVEKRMN